MFNSVLAHNPFQKGASRRWNEILNDMKIHMQNSSDLSMRQGPFPSEYKSKKHLMAEVDLFQREDNKKRGSTGTDNEVYEERERLLYEISQLIQDAESSSSASAAETARKDKLAAEGKEIRDAASRTEPRTRERSSTSKRNSTSTPSFQILVDSLDNRYKREAESRAEKLAFKKRESSKRRRIEKRKIHSDNRMFVQMKKLQEETLDRFERMQQENAKSNREGQLEMVKQIMKVLEK